MSIILKHFDALTDRGIQAIPLHENSKVPRLKRWSTEWNKDQCRFMFRKFPYSNMGIKLGTIVDVEGDTPQANYLLRQLIGDYPHPTYTSSRSEHHLFVTPDPSLRILKHQGMEFRGFGHQSVLPPSMCKGVRYSWSGNLCFPIPQMPEKLLRHYLKLKRGKYNLLKDGHKQILCWTCSKKQFMHKKRLDLEIRAFKLMNERWQCRKCRKHDLRPICRELRKQSP